MKMKIPIIDPTNIYSNHESSDYLSSDNSDSVHQEENDSAVTNDDFSEYLWMENEEEFDKQILQQLEEEALMEHCLEVMLDHERDLQDHLLDMSEDGNQLLNNSQEQHGSDICHQMSNLRVQDKDELAKQSTLNPNAAEFVPQSRTASSPLVEKTS
uniref:Uncharacterized protein n=1 Tax=Cuerna arida TaxID=1464854 RepID=A0A1B6F570_9HEMI